MRLKFLTLTTLLLAATQTAYAQDSLQHASDASGDSVVSSARFTEAGIKMVAGATAAPLKATAFSLATPALSMQMAGYLTNNDSLGQVGMIAMAPAAIVLEPAMKLEKFSEEPLQISSETFFGKPVVQPESSN